VTGIDSSPSLIQLCRERFPAAEWHVADMRTLDLNRRYDGLIAWHSFFHLQGDDQRAMFPIFAATAAPGAILTFTSGPLAGVAMGEWQGEPLFHDSLAPEEYRALLAANKLRGPALHRRRANRLRPQRLAGAPRALADHPAQEAENGSPHLLISVWIF
jgi:trans-aconitate methyltransferase